jgi:hypothetical protein
MKIEITYSRYPNMKEARLFEKRTIKIFGISFTVWKQVDWYRGYSLSIRAQIPPHTEQR